MPTRPKFFTGLACMQCGHAWQHPEFRTCDACRKAHRERNRRYHAKHRERINAEKNERDRVERQRRIDSGYVTPKMTAMAVDRAAVELAEMNGKVPSCNELAAYLDIPMGSAGLVRRRAFKLKPQRSGSHQPFIPYPVPKKYRAVGDEWEAPSRRRK